VLQQAASQMMPACCRSCRSCLPPQLLARLRHQQESPTLLLLQQQLPLLLL
jgi:hypothetical protein